MPQLTYEQVRDRLETTEIGYTIASQDRFWTVFLFDENGERLYFTTTPNVTSYDVWSDELFWDNRREADAYRDSRQEEFGEHTLYVINWGDEARSERSYLDRRKHILRGKFRGSDDALAELARRRQARR